MALLKEEQVREITADLLHLEVMLVTTSFANYLKAPKPAAQLNEILESYENYLGLEQDSDGGRISAQPVTKSVLGNNQPLEERLLHAVESRTAMSILERFQNVARAAADGKQPETAPDPPALNEAPSTMIPKAVFGELETGLQRRSADAQTRERIEAGSKKIVEMLSNPIGGAAESMPKTAGTSTDISTVVQNTENILTVRKLWETRSPDDVIVVRTVIGLDGDVITQINPEFAAPEFTILHQLHQQGVVTCVSFWKELVSVLSDFISIVFNKIYQ